MSLYADLGVDPAASTEEIRRAFKQKAKRTHPDAGGDPADFDRLTKARNVLVDPRARERYDRTGRMEEPEPDNDSQQALAAAIQALDAASGAVEGNGLKLESVDLIALSIAHLQDEIRQEDKKLRDATKMKSKIAKLAKRFRAKAGKVDRIGRSLESRVRDLECVVEAHQTKIRLLRMGIDILNEHTFDVEPQQRPEWGMGLATGGFGFR